MTLFDLFMFDEFLPLLKILVVFRAIPVSCSWFYTVRESVLFTFIIIIVIVCSRNLQ